MKIINILCITFSIAIGLTIWKISEPLVVNGTAVIHVANKQHNYTVLVPNNITNRQQELLNFAHQVAVEDGYQHPAFLQGVLMQESRACSVQNFRVAGLTNKPNNRYFGCGQVKIRTAKEVMQRYPELWKYLDSRIDEELQARLILDDKFNIRVSSKYLLMMGINENASRAITAYNVGPEGVKNIKDHENFDYTAGVKNFSKILYEKNVQVEKDKLQLESKPMKILLARDS